MATAKEIYADIIDLPRPLSKRPKMAVQDRAAQFSPFAALTGYDAEIDETARLTDTRAELDESAKEALNAKLQCIRERLSAGEQPMVNITYFHPDVKKAGGAYVQAMESIKRIDEITKTIRTVSGLVIPIENLFAIEGDRLEQE